MVTPEHIDPRVPPRFIETPQPKPYKPYGNDSWGTQFYEPFPQEWVNPPSAEEYAAWAQIGNPARPEGGK